MAAFDNADIEKQLTMRDIPEEQMIKDELKERELQRKGADFNQTFKGKEVDESANDIDTTKD